MNYFELAIRKPPRSANFPAAFVVNAHHGAATASTLAKRKTATVLREKRPRYRTSSGSREPGPESILHMAWRNASLERASVKGRDGHTYSIVYGGRPGGSLGPDFTDAVIERDDGTVFRGDIEIHVRESDWNAHGHQRDPRYNGVVLHVVAHESIHSQIVNATGSSIPLLALNWKKPAGGSPKPSPSDTSNSTPPSVKPLLPVRAAGLERFHAQAAGIALDISTFGPDQAIWLGVLGALGYPRNKRAFRAVGTRLKWEVVSTQTDANLIEKMLLFAAELEDNLESNSGELDRNELRTGPKPQWVKPWGRPANSPVSRIKSIAKLVPLWTAQGGIAAASAAVVSGAQKPRDLQQLLRPRELVRQKSSGLIGKSRTAEIVVNVLLPAVFAMSTQQNSDHRLSTQTKNRCVDLFSNHPPLPANSVTKEAIVALGLDFTLPEITNARDQQGLIALYREMYRSGIKDRQPRLPGV